MSALSKTQTSSSLRNLLQVGKSPKPLNLQMSYSQLYKQTQGKMEKMLEAHKSKQRGANGNLKK